MDFIGHMLHLIIFQSNTGGVVDLYSDANISPDFQTRLED